MLEEVDIVPKGTVTQYGLYGPSITEGVTYGGTCQGFCTEVFANLGISTTFPADVANRALLKARLKVKDSDINLAQAFAERAQTAAYVAETLNRMSGIIKAFKKRNFGALRRYFRGDIPSKMLKTLTDEWLKLQYALRPLMSDIHGAVTSLEKTPYDEYIVTVKATSKRLIKDKVFVDKPTNGSHNAHYSVDVDYAAKSFVRIDLQPENAALIMAAKLGFTNPAYLAWELTKLSFVVDWALPLGDYFSQFDALAGWNVKGYSQSNLLKISAKPAGHGFTIPGSYPCASNYKGSYFRVSLGRTCGATVPFATLPSVKNPFSKSHIMSALALLRQACA
jgi:hypothetical protein